MKTCPDCEARNSDQTAFCIRCGADLAGAAASPDPGGNTDALPIVPETTPAALVNRGATLLAEGKAAAALAECRRAIALEPGHVEAHAVLGMAYEQQGELAAALEAYEAVLGLAPDRAVERQKAAILRLRLEGEVATAPAGAPRPLHPVLEQVRTWLTVNPPLTYGVAAAMLVLIIGSIFLVHAQREARRQEQLAQTLAFADQAMTDGRYEEATRQYSYAYSLNPKDETIRNRWDQAYRMCLQGQTPPNQIAELPKYLPSQGPNPFAPVRIGETPLPPGTMPGTMPGAVPPLAAPTAPLAPPPAYTQWGGKPLTPVPSPTVTPGTGGTGRNGVRPGTEPISPVGPKTPVKPGTTTPATPAQDTTPKPPKSEVTIWVSDTPPAQTSNAGESRSDASSMRARADQLARSGRTDEAIAEYGRAAGAYEDAARRDPATAAVSRQAAQSCRNSADVLRTNP